MSAVKDGGSAFPNVDSRDNPNFPGQRDIYASSGMTLRDWFAGQALVGFLSVSPSAVGDQARNNDAAAAGFAYAVADAMLAERSKQP